MSSSHWNAVAILAAFCCFGIGCASNDSGRPQPDGGMRCLTAAQCDDMIACTSDSCGVSGTCEHTTLDALCMPGETCVVGRGCTSARPCTMSSECDDMIACTVDSCAVGGMCAHMPVDALCTMPGQVCNVMTGCGTPMGCASAAECNDMIPCTVDGCNAARMCTHTAIDAMCMMGERCVVGTGCMMMRACTTDDECQDTDFCNGREICTTEFGCAAAPMPRNCADTDACTVDTCNTTANMCVHTCDPSMPACGCTPTPDCNGTFTIAPAPTQNCALGMVNYNVSTVMITCTAVSWSAVPSGGRPVASLDQVPAPAGADFDLSGVNDGACRETYRLRGTFADANHFTATWSATFTETMAGACDPLGIGPLCPDYSLMVTGTRM